jgi:GST-like protein
MIELYTAPTPNGHKASCTLEALGFLYETHFVNTSECEQKSCNGLCSKYVVLAR